VRKNYREGDWFAIPLRGGGFAAGIVARSMPDDGGINLGYFFGPSRDDVPHLSELAPLKPSDAVLVRRFGDLGLIEGSWPVIGRTAEWDRSLWPIPRFGRFEGLTNRAFEVIYEDNDPSMAIREILTGKDKIFSLPVDRLSGSGAIEIVLTHRLT
jgi:hypothetical protein